MVYQSVNKNNNILLTLKDICLDYGPIQVLNDISLDIKQGEIHAIVGEHGAGKSSLAMIICGLLKAKSGYIKFLGKNCRNVCYKEFKKLGIDIVFQKIQLNDTFSVADNLFLTNRSIVKSPMHMYNKKKINNLAEDFLSKYGFDINPQIKIDHLKQSDKALISILKSVYTQPKILILDEALEKLSSFSLNKVVDILKELKNNGSSIIFITHRIDDIYSIANRVSIIRNGELLLTEDISKIDKINLIKIAYIQINKSEGKANSNKEFYQLLKYNEAILKNLPINLLVTDNENRIKMVNDFAKTYFKLKNTTFLNSQLKSLFTKENKGVYKILEKALIKNKMSSYYNTPFKLAKIKTIINIIVYPIYDGIMLLGHIIIIEDVSDREKLREQLIISEKLASVGLLAAGIAHEINNPLGIIYNYLDSLKFLETLNKESNIIIDQLYDQMEYIVQIISNLITFSDNKKIKTEEIEINQLIKSLIHLLQYNAKYKNISINLITNEKHININANINEIKQVLLNLFKNSFEAMPHGGEIEIITSMEINEQNKALNLIFRDTGCGIHFENPNDIFLPFNSTKKDANNNFGLGLSVSYGIIKKYNGNITIKNLDTAGCEFNIKFPIKSLY